MKRKFLILIFCAATSAFAQDIITFEWDVMEDPFQEGSGIGYQTFYIKATANKEFTISWGDGITGTYIGIGTENNYIEYQYKNLVGGGALNPFIVTITATTEDCYFTHLYYNINNNMVSLDLTKSASLIHLDCSFNSITTLDIANHQYLESLVCCVNRLPLSNLFTISEKIKVQDKKIFGTQYLLPQTVNTSDTLFSEESVFNDIFTNYTVINNDVPALETDYVVVDGKLIFNAAGIYTVTMTNDAIISNNDYPAKAIVTVTVAEDPITHTITAYAIGSGIIAPEGIITVPHGENQTFIIAGAIGCSIIKHLWVDGKDEFWTPGMPYYEYTFTNVTADHTIVAEFELEINDNDLIDLFIYPNPTDGEFQISNTKYQIPNTKYQFFNVTGEEIFTQIITEHATHTIDISHLPAGIYFLKIDNQTIKIIKN